MSNSLVAPEQAPAATAGAGLLSDIAVLAGDHSALDFTVDGVSAGLDAIGAGLDPFGAIAGAGVGWLLEHVSFLREPLDQLTGDAAAIAAASTSWTAIADSLDEAAGRYGDDLGATAPWTGAAADDYRAAARDYIVLLQAMAGQCRSTASGLEVTGVVIGTERALIHGAISQFVGRCVVEAVAALAASWFTFGGSLAAFIALVDVDASIQAEQDAMRVGALTKRIASLAAKLDGISSHAEQVATAVDRSAGKLRMRIGGMKGRKTIARNRLVRRNPDGAIGAIDRFEHSGTHDAMQRVRTVAGRRPVRYGWQAVKQAEHANHDGADDGADTPSTP